jgi:flagellar basal body-associated protein FliL
MGTSVQVTNNDGKGGTIVSIIAIVILLSVSGFLYVLYNKANKELKTEQDNKEKL